MATGPWEEYSSSTEEGPWSAYAPTKPAPKPEMSDLARGFKSYGPQTEETIGGLETVLGAGAKKVLGQGAISDYLLKGGTEKLKESQAKQEELSKPSDSLSNAWHQGIGTVLTDWLPYQIGQGAANALETVATTAGGALIGSALPVGGTAAGGVAGLVSKQLVKKGIKEAAEKILKSEGEEAAKNYVEKKTKETLLEEEAKTLAKSGAGYYGGAAANAMQAAYHGLGEVGSRSAEQLQEEGKNPEDMDLTRVGPASAIHALADYAAERIGLGSFKGLSNSTKNVFLDVGANMLKTGAKEVPAELLQQAAERYGASLPLTDKNAIQEYVDTAGAAFGMSVMPGAIGGVRTRLAAPAEQAQAQAQETDDKQIVEKPDLHPVDENEKAAVQTAMLAAGKAGVPLTKTTPLDLMGASPNATNNQMMDIIKATQAKKEAQAEKERLAYEAKAEKLTDPFLAAVKKRLAEGEEISPEEQAALQQELDEINGVVPKETAKPEAKETPTETPIETPTEAPKATTPFGKFLEQNKDVKDPQELAEKAYDEGFLLEDDMDKDGGVSKLQEMMQNEKPAEPTKEDFVEPDQKAVEEEMLLDAAHRYGIDTDGLSMERITNMVRRIDRKLEENKAKNMKPEQAVDDAKSYADKFEANRDRYEEGVDGFADLPIHTQDDILDVVLDNDGNPTVVSHLEGEAPALTPNDVMYSSRAFQGHNTTREQERNAKELQGKTMLEVAQWAVDRAPNRVAKYFAKLVNTRLQQLAERGMKMDFQILNGTSRPLAMRNANGRTSYLWGLANDNTSVTVQLNGPTVVKNQASHPPGTDYTTVLHELLHVATRGQMRFLGSTDPIVKEINQLYGRVRAHLQHEIRMGRATEFMHKINSQNNALESPDEMVTWSITDRDMQDFMSSIKVGPQTAFQKIVQMMRDLLGVQPQFESALDRLVRTTDIILKEDTRKIGDQIEQQGYSFGSKQAMVQSRIKKHSLFSRKVQQMLADELDSRNPGFYFNAKESPLYKTRTAEEVKPVTEAEAEKAIRANKTGARILDKNVPLPHGELVGARLDLNILRSSGVPVLAIHQGSESDRFPHGSTAGYWSKDVIKYLPTVTLRKVFFKVNQPVRERIASGLQNKEPMASADGKFVPTEKPNFDGVELGFNPKSTHLFQDALGRVVKYADEVTITGNKLFARGNLEYYGLEDVPARKGEAPTTGKVMEPTAEDIARKPKERGKVEAKAAPSPIQDDLFNKRDQHISQADFRLAGDTVDGLVVRDEVPNTGSISSSLEDYTVLPGIREVPMSAFEVQGKPKYYSSSEEKRTLHLAEQIKENKEINPLIVVVDAKGPYILEGGHRFDALRELGVKSFPALVVQDNEDVLHAINLPKNVQQAKAMAQTALQKRAPMPKGAFAGMSAAAIARAEPKFYAPNVTILDRIDGLKDNFWKRVAQKTVDQFRSIKDVSQLGYMMARLSKSVDGALEGLLFHGQVFNDGGALNIRKGTEGLTEILKPLGQEVDRFHIWMALNREARLPADKRSPDLAPLIADLPEYTRGTINGKPRTEVYEKTREKMQALNKSVLDVAKSMGLLDDAAYKRFSNDMFYIPFYRAMEDGNIDSIKTASTLTNQYFSKELKGKNDKAFGDLMENTLRNWSHILSASMKNQAAVQTLKDAESLGVVTRLGTNAGPKVDTAVKVRENGELVYYDVHDAMLLESISNITFLAKSNAYLDVAKAFKNALRFGVTLSPAFKVSNLIKDSIQSAALSGLSKNIGKNLIDGWALAGNKNPAYASMLAGGAIFNFGTTNEGDQAAMVKKLIAQGVNPKTILMTPQGLLNGAKQVLDMYERLGNRTEAANRAALYQQLRDRGLSHLEASYQARDLMDFSMQGSSNAFRYLTTTVPFLNARLQGLYKLGRDGLIPTTRVIYNSVTGKPIDATDKQKAAQFSAVAGSVMLASMMLYLAFKDDDDFKKREDWDRDNFWWIKLPGMDSALRIPKPFEIGAFGTLAERTLEQIVDQGAEGKQFGDSISRMLTNTFSLNPIPQWAKPLVDVYANKDSFTGAPIETAGLERLSKQERMTDMTSPLAKALGGLSHAVANVTGEGTELSPVQIDYMIRSYLGWMGGTMESATYYAMMPFNEGEYPDMKKLDVASLGFIKSLPSNQSSYVNSFYENNKLINQAYSDMRHYAEMGDFDKVAKIQEEKGDKIVLQKLYDSTSKKIANVRKQILVVTNDPSMSGTDKREELDRLKEIISMYAQQAEELRKSYK